MRQLRMLLLLAPAAAGLFCLFQSCNTSGQCRDLSGHWTTQEGQDLIFLHDGKALWLTRFGSRFDTNRMEYHLECNANLITLDLSNFQTGPHTGKTLFGILEWSSDTSFRLRYEPGLSPEVRPTEFDNDQAVKFVRTEEGK